MNLALRSVSNSAVVDSVNSCIKRQVIHSISNYSTGLTECCWYRGWPWIRRTLRSRCACWIRIRCTFRTCRSHCSYWIGIRSSGSRFRSSSTYWSDWFRYSICWSGSSVWFLLTYSKVVNRYVHTDFVMLKINFKNSVKLTCNF